METTIKPFENVRPDVSVKKKINADPLVLWGHMLLATSFAIYLIVENITLEKPEAAFSVFLLHYLLALGFVVGLIANKAYGVRRSWRRANIDRTVILLNLFLISAYALNREIAVFAESTSWLCVYLMITSVALLSFRYFESLPVWINRIQQLILGSAVLFYCYLAIYVLDVYGLGSVGILFFGIGAHVFVPLTFVAASIFLILYTIRKPKGSLFWIAAGSAVTLGFVLVFMGEWNTRISKIETLVNQAPVYQNNELPVWVSLAQNLRNDWISEKIIKSDLVYTTHNRNRGWNSFPASWDEEKKHDPLVVISTIISTCPLSVDDRVKILQSVFSNRHNANERLWSGDNLTTSYIVTDVDIYPSLRLAYTEKYLNVKNNISSNGWWGNTQEAIYTFQLTEGSVITSLSLWIEGKEEKGILTSKQKATEAYEKIVGVERRDPSVVHWQEGNTVSVRVFPCTPDEERKFKIGITSPLVEQDGEVIYNNVTFRGPSPNQARETVRVRFVGSADDISLSDYFEKDVNGDYYIEHQYDPDFRISFGTLPLQPNQFSFDGYTYSMKPYKPQFETSSIDQVFLDINSSWSGDEIDAAEALIRDFKVYAAVNNRFIQLTDENWREIIDEMRQRNFSVFPFHLVHNHHGSLVISKGQALSPHLADFKDSKFSEQIGKYFANGHRVKVFNLEGGTSTYIRALREFRSLEFAEGNMEQLMEWLSAGKYPVSRESEGKIILHDAKVVITKAKSDLNNKLADNAPDHLARLFAYNNIMRKVGQHYFENELVSDELVEEASTAYVVSPVSSLIVLETKRDYERFGIEDNLNSLQNATKQSTGAVPEPHEWALLILFLLFILYLKFGRSKFGYTT